jgi:hypothetical protein
MEMVHRDSKDVATFVGGELRDRLREGERSVV